MVLSTPLHNNLKKETQEEKKLGKKPSHNNLHSSVLHLYFDIYEKKYKVNSIYIVVIFIIKKYSSAVSLSFTHIHTHALQIAKFSVCLFVLFFLFISIDCSSFYFFFSNKMNPNCNSFSRHTYTPTATQATRDIVRVYRIFLSTLCSALHRNTSYYIQYRINFIAKY